MLNQGNIHHRILKYQRIWFIFSSWTNMRIEKMLERSNSGEWNWIFRNIHCVALVGLIASGKPRKDTSIVVVLQEKVYFRALQGHSGCNLIDLLSQDNVVIQSNFFQYFYHVGCAINLLSIINSWLTLGGQNLSNRQTVFFLLVDPMDKNHKDLDDIDLSVPRHAQYMHKAWKRHQDTVYWFDINFAMSNAIIFQETLPAYCIPKVVRKKLEKSHSKGYTCQLRLPPKISLKHEWKRELVSEHAQRLEGQVVQPSGSFQSNQPTPNPSLDRSGQPVVRTEWSGPPFVGADTRTVQDGRKTSRSQEIDVTSFHDETVSLDWSEQPVVETNRKLCQMVAKHVLVMKA